MQLYGIKKGEIIKILYNDKIVKIRYLEQILDWDNFRGVLLNHTRDNISFKEKDFIDITNTQGTYKPIKYDKPKMSEKESVKYLERIYDFIEANYPRLYNRKNPWSQWKSIRPEKDRIGYESPRFKYFKLPITVIEEGEWISKQAKTDWRSDEYNTKNKTTSSILVSEKSIGNPKISNRTKRYHCSWYEYRGFKNIDKDLKEWAKTVVNNDSDYPFILSDGEDENSHFFIQKYIENEDCEFMEDIPLMKMIRRWSKSTFIKKAVPGVGGTLSEVKKCYLTKEHNKLPKCEDLESLAIEFIRANTRKVLNEDGSYNGKHYWYELEKHFFPQFIKRAAIINEQFQQGLSFEDWTQTAVHKECGKKTPIRKTPDSIIIRNPQLQIFKKENKELMSEYDKSVSNIGRSKSNKIKQIKKGVTMNSS